MAWDNYMNSIEQEKLAILWAKKTDSDDNLLWLPLCTHLKDGAAMAKLVWDNWVPHSAKLHIARGIFTKTQDSQEWANKQHLARQLLVFLQYAHDIGKASPVFQKKPSRKLGAPTVDRMLCNSITDAGSPLESKYPQENKIHHSLVSYGVLERNGFDASVAVIVGGHHGKPPSTDDLENISGAVAYKKGCGFTSPQWVMAQDAILKQALDEAGFSKAFANGITISRTAQVLLSGLVIMIDWIISNSEPGYFPLIPLDDPGAKPNSCERAAQAYNNMNLPEAWLPDSDWDNLYYNRFPSLDGKELRPVQAALLDAIKSTPNPGIVIIEAPMGEGKTEAALAAAEVLAQKKGCRGLYFALPTQATSNAMFERVVRWIMHLEGFAEKASILLTHGKADLNDLYESIRLGHVQLEEDAETSVGVHSWLRGRKKGILSDFVIGTIDHVLMAGLKQKHLVLRHLGLAGKVVVIDECHAYDVYMESYLLKALNWLGAYGVPVVLLSATLPTARRKDVIEAYLNKKGLGAGEEWAQSLAYPLVTFTDGEDVHWLPIESSAKRGKSVRILPLEEGDLVHTLDTALHNGGCAGVIVNTVKDAQEKYALLKKIFGDDCVELLHGAFLSCDRMEKEKELVSGLGPGEANRSKFKIVVGTQIFEQSMDIDFDVMVTDLCPMDLLLQRIGRLHRHNRSRPLRLEKACCYVMGTQWDNPSTGSQAVYGKYLLMRTCASLPRSITLPDDIPGLVAKVYDDEHPPIPEAYIPDYEIACMEREQEIKERKSSAKTYQINGPRASKTLLKWLDSDVGDDSEKRGEASVRDGADSIEVLVIQKRANELCFLPWIENGSPLPKTTPSEPLAKKIAACSLRLPGLFGRKYIIDKAIKELEDTLIAEGIKDPWYQSSLKGSLFLFLDDKQETTLCGYRLGYDRHLGLWHKKLE